MTLKSSTSNIYLNKEPLYIENTSGFGGNGLFKGDLLTSDRFYILPNKSGSIALMDDVNSTTFGSNGITKVGNTFNLGGNLNQNTTITTGSNIFSIAGSNGLRYTTDISSNYTNRSLVDKAYVDALVNNLSGENTTAGNGLSMSGNNVILGGTLNQNTTITTGSNTLTVAGSNGLRYAIDISSNYTNRSLVDKQYVDGLVNTITTENTTTGNGLTMSGRTVELGGTLTQDTTIDGGSKELIIRSDKAGYSNVIRSGGDGVFGAPGNNIQSYVIGSGTITNPNYISGIYQNPGSTRISSENNTNNDTTSLTVSNSTILMNAFNNTNNDTTSLTVNNSNILMNVFTTVSSSELDILPESISISTNTHYANLKTNLLSTTRNFEFPNNSGTIALLSDITGGGGSVYFGSNGITKVDNTFNLGGTLNQNTTITTGSNTLTVAGSNGLRYAIDISSNYTNRSLVDKQYTDNKISDIIYSSGWNGITSIAPSQNAVYDKIETISSHTLRFSKNSINITNILLDNGYGHYVLPIPKTGIIYNVTLLFGTSTNTLIGDTMTFDIRQVAIGAAGSGTDVTTTSGTSLTTVTATTGSQIGTRFNRTFAFENLNIAVTSGNSLFINTSAISGSYTASNVLIKITIK